MFSLEKTDLNKLRTLTPSLLITRHTESKCYVNYLELHSHTHAHRQTHTMHVCTCTSAQWKISDWKFNQTKLISHNNGFLLPWESTGCHFHPRVCAFECEWQSIMSLWEPMCKRKDEVSHDETDIDMLSRAKKSCERYLISTQRPYMHQRVLKRWNSHWLTRQKYLGKSFSVKHVCLNW